MSLLFDENLSRRLVARLEDTFPGARHVVDLGLAEASDSEIWRVAASENLAIISKDDDFRQRAQLFGAPPKVIWVRAGNCSTDDIEALIRERAPQIRDFLAESESAIMIITPQP